MALANGDMRRPRDDTLLQRWCCVVALMARRERTRRRKYRPYVSNHFTQHVAFDIRVIRVLTGALSKVISVVDGIRRAFP